MKPRDFGCATSTEVMDANKTVLTSISDGLTKECWKDGKGFSWVAKGPPEAGFATF